MIYRIEKLLKHVFIPNKKLKFILVQRYSEQVTLCSNVKENHLQVIIKAVLTAYTS